MSRWLRRWLISAAFLCAGASVAAGVVVVPIDSDAARLADAVQVLEDPTRQLDLDAVARLPSRAWSAPAESPLDFGISTSTWWLRVQLRNPSDAERVERLLEITSPRQDEIELMLVRGNGIVQRFPVTGDRHPFAQRPLSHRNPVFPVAIEPQETVKVYVRVASHDGLNQPMALIPWTREAFAAHAQAQSLLYGLYFGGLLALLVYNLFLFASARVAGLGAYAAYLGALLTWTATFNGFTFQYLLPAHPALVNLLLVLSSAACFVTGVLFVVRYLPTRREAPRWHALLIALAVADTAAAVPALFGHFLWAYLFIVPLGCATAAAGLGVALRFVLRGNRPARYLLASWLVMGLGVAVYLLSMLSLLPPSAGTDAVAMIQGGLAFEVLVLAFGLADAVNAQKASALRAEHDARVAQETLAQRLEQQVQQRTLELGQANAQLNQQAITDELTGVFNRRHFNAVFDAEMRRRSDRVLGLCLVDVDHFKAYNDTYGHAAGDATLKTVAATLQQGLRRAADLIFRVGGEEFAIVFRAADAAEACGYIENLREALVRQSLPHAAHPLGVVTASFGLALAENSAQDCVASDLYEIADAALYSAKAAGRNVVRCTRVAPSVSPGMESTAAQGAAVGRDAG